MPLLPWEGHAVPPPGTAIAGEGGYTLNGDDENKSLEVAGSVPGGEPPGSLPWSAHGDDAMSEKAIVIIDWDSGLCLVHEDAKSTSMDLHMLQVWLNGEVIRRAREQVSEPGAKQNLST